MTVVAEYLGERAVEDSSVLGLSSKKTLSSCLFNRIFWKKRPQSYALITSFWIMDDVCLDSVFIVVYLPIPNFVNKAQIASMLRCENKVVFRKLFPGTYN